jgi:hypothetical protein
VGEQRCDSLLVAALAATGKGQATFSVSYFAITLLLGQMFGLLLLLLLQMT